MTTMTAAIRGITPCPWFDNQAEEAARFYTLKDTYGVSWQVVPAVLGRMLGDPDSARSQRAMKAMLQMKKIDIETLERAFHG